MVRVRVTCAMSGPTFSPTTAERTTGLTFHRQSELNQRSSVDRFQGRPATGGSAELVIQEYGELADLSGRNGASLMALGRSIEALRRSGATELQLRFEVEYAGSSCQFELPPELQRRLADLGIPLVVACFPSDETEELGSRSVF
jgi:hypothetical protein